MPVEDVEDHLARSGGSKVAALLARIWSAATAGRGEKSLRLREMLPLGDKRFLAVVECDRQRFLLAGTAQQISLLEHLRASERDDDVAEGADR